MPQGCPRISNFPLGGQAGSFPVTLAQAFDALGLGLEVPPELHQHLSAAPHHLVQQCLFLLGVAVKRLRNDAGTGHGRPDGPRRTAALSCAEGRLVTRATLLAGLLLDEL